jgi:hypothetical protein
MWFAMNGSAIPPRPTRYGLAVAAAALALLAASCAGGGSSTGSPASAGSSASAVAYSACIRAHGVPNYPDPDSSGNPPKGDAQHFGVGALQFQAAQHACRHLLPTGGSLQQREFQCMQDSSCPQSLVRHMMTADRRLARCMRTHGVPTFPDPTLDSHGPVFNISAVGISDAASHTRKFETRLNECAHLVRDNAPESFG